MAKGDLVVLRVDSIVAGGMGLAKDNGRPVFIDFTAPGDLIQAKIIEEKESWSRAELLEILEPSPQRMNPLCPLFGHCGGCSFQHLQYEAQLKAKEAILRESFIRIGGFKPESLPRIKVRPSTPWEYRSRVQFHCVPGRRNNLGFKERKGREVIPIGDCPIADPGIREALSNNKQKKLAPPPQKDRFTVFSRKDLFLSEGGKNRGRITLKGKEIQKELLLDARVFFQGNAAMLELLLEDLAVLACNADHDTAFGDIYCGVGTFAAFLGDIFPIAELAEENRMALALARENVCGKNGLFYALSGEEWIKIRKPHKEKWGLLVVDPPRQGLSKTMRMYLGAQEIDILAYVSCDPATISRDSKDLAAAGFYLQELSLYDFYPQTSHIESLAVFFRK